MTRKKLSAKKTETIKIVEPKGNDDVDDPELVITGFKAILHLRTRKTLKEKEIA